MNTTKSIISANTIYYILIFILFLPLIIWRDYTPVNELRYLSIAEEAIKNGTLFSFTNHNEMYADKPPLYFWIVMIGKIIFGSHQMWFLSLFSLIPAFIIQYVMDKWTRFETSASYRFSAKLMLFTTAIFLGASIILRMDMLMCMFIILALYTFYKMYTTRAGIYDKYLLPLYLFLAVFSKGPMGILIPVVSIISFLTIKGKIKETCKYLGLRTWGIIFILCSVWFALTWMESGTEYLKDLLFNQTYNRAVSSFHHKEPFHYYFLTYFYSFAPWSLLYIVLIITGIKNKLIKTDVDKFFLTIITSSLLFLSMISSKIEIYLLPIYPFVSYLSVIILQRMKYKKWIKVILVIMSFLLLLIQPVFWGSIQRTESILPLHDIRTTVIIAFIVLALFSSLSLYFLLFKSHITKSINSISIGILATIFILSFQLPFLNSYIGFENMCKRGMLLSPDKKTFIAYNIKRPENMDVYLKIPVMNVLKDDILSGEYSNSVLLISARAVRKDNDLKEFLSKKETIKVGKNIVVKL